MDGFWKSDSLAYFTLLINNSQSIQTLSTIYNFAFLHFDLPKAKAVDNVFSRQACRLVEQQLKLRGLCSHLQQVSKISRQQLIAAQNEFELEGMTGMNMIQFITSEIQTLSNTITQLQASAAFIRNNFIDIILKKELFLFLGESDSHRPLHSLKRCAGAIRSQDKSRLQRILFRISRGNFLLSTRDIHQSQFRSFKGQDYSVFVVYFNASYLQQKIINLLQGFSQSRIIEIPGKTYIQNFFSNYLQVLSEKESLLLDCLHQAENTLSELCNSKFGCRKVDLYSTILQKYSSVLQTLSWLQPSGNFVKAAVWSSEKDAFNVQKKISSIDGVGIYRCQFPRSKVPPALYRTNQYTAPYFELVHIYSQAQYQQISPAPFTMVTFPFFFGIMFGDMGHAALLFLASAWLPYKWQVRACAFFAFLSGILYNQFFGLKISLWESCYRQDLKQTCVYPVGIDPIWGLAQNQLMFLNSFKMKFSLIIGFFHLSLGLSIQAANRINAKEYKALLISTLPKFGLLFSTVGYLVFLIIWKWSMDFSGRQGEAPSVISYAILTFLGGDDYSEAKFSKSEFIYLKQSLFVFFLLNLTVLLLGQKLIGPLQQCFKCILKVVNTFIDGPQRHVVVPSEVQEQQLDLKQPQQQSSFLLHVVDTMEYVLSCLSSSTSYLRLFALSLAHQKLTQLLLHMLLRPLQSAFPSVLSVVLRMGLYTSGTVGMLLCVDSLECTLHVVRLHWVQFMGKFYKGQGRLFRALGNEL